MTARTLPEDAKERKAVPLQSGVLDYFPSALIEVARVSKAGNDQHNPGEPLHWSRGKSNDHADALLRHQVDHGGTDSDGLLHSAKVAWRALAQLQMELEAAGAPLARGAVPSRVSAHCEYCPGVDAPGHSGPDGGTPESDTLILAEGAGGLMLFGDALWDARVSACCRQGELAVHSVGVCSKCDKVYPMTSDIKRAMWYATLSPHIAEP